VLAADSIPVGMDIVDAVRSANTTWTPVEPKDSPFYGMTEERIKEYLGLILEEEDPEGVPIVRYSDELTENGLSLPEKFDPIEKWGKCIHPIRDQLKCGSCWAFAASETLSDRLCIASKGQINEVLSPQDMVSCNKRNKGCHGGSLSRAFKYLESKGIVSDVCFPYTAGAGHRDTCLKGACVDTQIPYEKFKCSKHSTNIFKDVDSIKLELMYNGPMETGFIVYEDFMYYSSGVYQFVTGKLLGGHAVKMVGWGEEDGVKYWICSNSWGTFWGDRGYFKIKMNSCEIDRRVFGCTPKLPPTLSFESY